MKKILRIFVWFFAVILLSVIVFLIASIQPVDRRDYRDTGYYTRMMEQLDSVSAIPVPAAAGAIRTGFAKINLTPSIPVATAGYGKRRGKTITGVHDSVYVRAIVFDNGTERVALVSADLLIIPPAVTARLRKELPVVGFSLDNTFLNATHTHNSIGNWGEGATGIIYGSYNDSIVSFIAQRIAQCVDNAAKQLSVSQIKYGAVQVPMVVKNRIDKRGTVDSLLHMLEIHREDGAVLSVVSFNGHATCLYSSDLELSRDYPGVLVDDLEKGGYDFAMFVSGAVGSHGISPPESGKPCLDWMADVLVKRIDVLKPALRDVADSTLMMVRVPLYLGEAQVKIARDWRVRPWVFRSAVGEYQPYLTALRLGNILVMGTPCDFSGSLTEPVRALAEAQGFELLVTSFNGHYIGYITEDQYYDLSHYETRLMNWYGPGNGAYLTECLSTLQRSLY